MQNDRENFTSGGLSNTADTSGRHVEQREMSDGQCKVELTQTDVTGQERNRQSDHQNGFVPAEVHFKVEKQTLLFLTYQHSVHVTFLAHVELHIAPEKL